MSKDRCYCMVEQVLFDILLYLPVMSLLRFKAVCKTWFSLIESSTFISEHLNHNRDNKNDTFIISYNDIGQGSDKLKVALFSGCQYEECVYDISNWQFWDSFDVVWMSGHCNGIVCLANKDGVALWNPALKQYRSLPQPIFSNRLKEHKFFSNTASFGIDVKRNSYKVVSMLLSKDMIGNQVEVYSLGDNSWRIIHKDNVLPFNDIWTFNAISSCRDGKCFWIASCIDYTPILLSFDFNDDVFSTMLLPHGNQDIFSNCHFDLDLLDNKVVYIVSDDHERKIEIWILHEFGLEKSWNIMHKIGPLSNLDFFYPRRISENGEFLISSKSDMELGEDMFYLYNLHTQQGKYLQNCNLDLFFGQLIRYNASLFSLKRADDVRLIK